MGRDQIHRKSVCCAAKLNWRSNRSQQNPVSITYTRCNFSFGSKHTSAKSESRESASYLWGCLPQASSQHDCRGHDL
ncbi:hypothetical protein D915_010959 [Fasciola hepatica]|uniref:Uncharacterized protein n=1 Tax=Fasciola hepatica TaxID=6192 RepID=A0A2H1BSG6_FASHE|nr:hypothetical protein D915_010959 [Fasciola hepatica]